MLRTVYRSNKRIADMIESRCNELNQLMSQVERRKGGMRIRLGTSDGQFTEFFDFPTGEMRSTSIRMTVVIEA